MAYSKKLIHFATKANFETLLAANNILDTSICFIQDAKQIWTHGVFYASPITEEEIKQLFGGNNIKLDGYVEMASPVNISDTDTVNEAFGKIEEYLGTLDELNAILVDTGDVASDPTFNDYITPNELNSALILKLDTISDLETIRQGAAKGTTALNNVDYYVGNNNISSIASVPVDKRLVIASISSSQSLSLASNLSAGKEVHIIIYNSGSSSISIALPNTGNYKCLVDTALSIDATNYAEINIISDGTNMYIRAI